MNATPRDISRSIMRRALRKAALSIREQSCGLAFHWLRDALREANRLRDVQAQSRILRAMNHIHPLSH
jgi:hypothetical protein